MNRKPVYWTLDKLEALKKLAMLGTTEGVAFIDWHLAISKNPKVRKVLSEKTHKQMRQAWCNYKHVMEGRCYSHKCNNKLDSTARHCKSCRQAAIDRANRLKLHPNPRPNCSVFNIQKYRCTVNKRISDMSKSQLVQFCQDNIVDMPVEVRINLLGNGKLA